MSDGWRVGDDVMVRDMTGKWHRAVARSEPRYDVQMAASRRHPTLTVSVDVGTWGHPVNWPAEDVRSVRFSDYDAWNDALNRGDLDEADRIAEGPQPEATQ